MVGVACSTINFILGKHYGISGRILCCLYSRRWVYIFDFLFVQYLITKSLFHFWYVQIFFGFDLYRFLIFQTLSILSTVMDICDLYNFRIFYFLEFWFAEHFSNRRETYFGRNIVSMFYTVIRSIIYRCLRTISSCICEV